MRIRLETDAVFYIIDKITKGVFELISSQVHLKEIESIEDNQEKIQLLFFLERFSKRVKYDLELAKNRTKELILKKISVADAAHLAFAEQFADILITCDNKFYKQSKRNSKTLQIMNPVEFCTKE